jgi:hypothetical protein
MDGIHPDTISLYYGVHGTEQTRTSAQTGAGHPEDDDIDSLSDEGSENGDGDGDDDDEWTELQHQIARDQAHNIRHKPVKVARHQNPFVTPEAETEFWEILAVVIKDSAAPDGFGVCIEEWESGYPEIEIIKTGARGKELEVVLPEAIWLPRAVLWAQGLDVMSRLVEVDSD